MFRKADYNLIYDRAANAHSAGYANDARALLLTSLYQGERTRLFLLRGDGGFVQGNCFYFAL
jgi:hypothetical protein